MEIILSNEVRDYIKELSSNSEKAQIVQYFDRQAELGHILKEPVSKVLQHGINEIRPGQHRFLFFYSKNEIVIVRAFRKKTQKTPNYEIKAAIRKKEAWRENE